MTNSEQQGRKQTDKIAVKTNRSDAARLAAVAAEMQAMFVAIPNATTVLSKSRRSQEEIEAGFDNMPI